MLFHDTVLLAIQLFHIQGSSWMFLRLQHFHAMHESLLFGFAFIVTDFENLVFFFCPVVICGCVGLMAITVLLLD